MKTLKVVTSSAVAMLLLSAISVNASASLAVRCNLTGTTPFGKAIDAEALTLASDQTQVVQSIQPFELYNEWFQINLTRDGTQVRVQVDNPSANLYARFDSHGLGSSNGFRTHASVLMDSDSLGSSGQMDFAMIRHVTNYGNRDTLTSTYHLRCSTLADQ